MDIYEQLGIPTFLNAYRPLTRLGGATIPCQVLDSMREASRKNVDLRIMQTKVGAAIASLTKNEAAYVSCGAASGIVLAVASCMAGTDPALSERLPNTEGMRNEVIMYACERGYKSDVAIRCAGATIVNVGTSLETTERDFLNAINEKTAAFFIHDGPHQGKLPLERVIALAKTCNVPVLIDAAFSVPPKESMWKYTRDKGADAVFISGGKGLRGPQSTGLVLGKAWIVKACTFHGSPNDRIGRGMKVGKEELAGIYTAVKLCIEQDESGIFVARTQQLDHILKFIRDVPLLSVHRMGPMKALVHFDSTVCGFTFVAASRKLLNLIPSVYLEPSKGGLIVSTECLNAGDEEIVGSQLRKLFVS